MSALVAKLPEIQATVKNVPCKFGFFESKNKRFGSSAFSEGGVAEEILFSKPAADAEAHDDGG